MERPHESGAELGIVCSDCAQEGFGEDRPKTLYVHLMDGTVTAIDGVTGIGMTGKAMVIKRFGAPSLTYPRSQLYYACCDKDRPPPSL